MREQRKIAFLRKQIEEYKEQTKNLQSENDALSKENQSLKRINSSLQDTINVLNHKNNKAKEKYTTQLIELEQLKQDYLDARDSAIAIKKKYQKEMEQFMARIRRKK